MTPEIIGALITIIAKHGPQWALALYRLWSNPAPKPEDFDVFYRMAEETSYAEKIATHPISATEITDKLDELKRAITPSTPNS